VPYGDDGSINPYPLFTVTAKDKATGKVLARTQAVLPVGSEMGCKNCHSGQWRNNGVTGISAQTAEGVLKIHDRRNRTDLAVRAAAGQPALDQSCHPDSLFNAKGQPGGLLSLPPGHARLPRQLPERTQQRVLRSLSPRQPHRGHARYLRDNRAAKSTGYDNCHGS